ncbi:aKG-HExxH-type peptide beta-hydroxylase [Streptomyces lasalocidi]
MPERDDVRLQVRYTDGRLTLRRAGRARGHRVSGAPHRRLVRDPRLASGPRPARPRARRRPHAAGRPRPLPRPAPRARPVRAQRAHAPRRRRTQTLAAGLVRHGRRTARRGRAPAHRDAGPAALPGPAGTAPGAASRGSSSATRREAFGALLSSTPATPVALAATLVHEVQHTKLAALSELVELHRAGPEARYFAPWRPDPRPYDGLLQGAYSHLAMADFFQRRALADPARGAAAWAEHARYHAQVGAALPALVGSPDLTPA